MNDMTARQATTLPISHIRSGYLHKKPNSLLLNDASLAQRLCKTGAKRNLRTHGSIIALDQRKIRRASESLSSSRQALVRILGRSGYSSSTTRRWSLLHERGQIEVLPGRLLVVLCGFLDAKGGMLVGDDIVFVLGIDGLVVRWHVDFVIGQFVFAEVLKEVGVAGPLHVNVRVASVFVLVRRTVECLVVGLF
jgi:hypothetical protein